MFWCDLFVLGPRGFRDSPDTQGSITEGQGGASRGPPNTPARFKIIKNKYFPLEAAIGGGRTVVFQSEIHGLCFWPGSGGLLYWFGICVLVHSWAQAAASKDLVPVMVEICREYDTGSEGDRHRLAAYVCLETLYRILGRSPLTLTPKDAKGAAKVVDHLGRFVRYPNDGLMPTNSQVPGGWIERLPSSGNTHRGQLVASPHSALR